MRAKNIFFVLVYIDEAHSTKWPIGLDYHPPPQATFDERLLNAKIFVNSHEIDDRTFKIVVDNWNNSFAEIFRSWPDKYYVLDENYRVLAKSEYGKRADALIDIDCLDLIRKIVE